MVLVEAKVDSMILDEAKVDYMVSWSFVHLIKVDGWYFRSFRNLLEDLRIANMVVIAKIIDLGTKEFRIFIAWEIAGIIEMVQNQPFLDSLN